MNNGHLIVYLLIFSAAFSLAGIFYARQFQDNLESYLVARNSQGSWATMLTLMASSLGAWILFAPAQAATWGGRWAQLVPSAPSAFDLFT